MSRGLLFSVRNIFNVARNNLNRRIKCESTSWHMLVVLFMFVLKLHVRKFIMQPGAEGEIYVEKAQLKEE